VLTCLGLAAAALIIYDDAPGRLVPHDGRWRGGRATVGTLTLERLSDGSTILSGETADVRIATSGKVRCATARDSRLVAPCVLSWFCYAATPSPTTFLPGGPMRRHALSLSMCAVTALLAIVSSCSKSKSGGTDTESKSPPKTMPAGSAAGAAEPSAGGAGPTKITVAAIAIVDVAPLYLGKEKGFFTEQNLDITIQNTAGGAESVPGVVSGNYQFAFANMISLLLAYSKGLPLKVIAAGNFSTGKAEDFGGILVPADSPIKTLKELEGKTLTVNQINNIGGVTVRAAMRKAGGDPDKIKFIEVRFPEMPAALAQKRVDAAWVVEPFLTVARSQGATVLSWNFAETAPSLLIASYFTTSEYAQQNPDIVKRFTAAINKSLTYASEHPDEARAILLTYTKIDKAIVDKLNLPLWTPKIPRESVDVLADLMVQDKMVDTKPDVAALLQ
jgi:NitT/TauT family transport system substrate-binding protein